MRILLVGAGGVGGAFAAIAARRDFFEQIVIADYDPARRPRRPPPSTTGSSRRRSTPPTPRRWTALCREHAHHARDERGRPACSTCRSSTAPSPPAPTTSTWRCRCRSRTPRRRTRRSGSSSATSSSPRPASGSRPDGSRWSGIGVEPGLSDVFARYAADHLFSEIDELGTRDGANLVVTDDDGNEIFAPSFSMWTTIEECLNPPVIWQDGAAGSPRAPFSEPEVFDFPEGIGPVECVNVEHEEVLLMPRWVDCKRATFKYGLGDEFINILKVLHTLGLDRTEKVRVKGVEVVAARRGGRRAARPGDGRPADEGQDLRRPLGDRHGQGRRSRGRRTSTTWSTTSGRCGSTATSAWSGRPRSTRSSRSSCSPAAPGAAPASSARRPSTRSRSSTCSTEYGSPWGIKELLTMSTAISLRGLSKHFGEVRAVDELDLDIADGEFFSMLGPSGSGKTTVLRLIAGFEQPTAGRILLGDADVTDRAAVRPRRQHRLPGLRALPAHERAPERRVRPAGEEGAAGRAAHARGRGAGARSASRGTPTAGRTSCPAGSGSGSRSPGPWSTGPRCSCSTSRSARST